jgi:hypothetical protein
MAKSATARCARAEWPLPMGKYSPNCEVLATSNLSKIHFILGEVFGEAEQCEAVHHGGANDLEHILGPLGGNARGGRVAARIGHILGLRATSCVASKWNRLPSLTASPSPNWKSLRAVISINH